jgi:hypothetical protein
VGVTALQQAAGSNFDGQTHTLTAQLSNGRMNDYDLIDFDSYYYYYKTKNSQ